MDTSKGLPTGVGTGGRIHKQKLENTKTHSNTTARLDFKQIAQAALVAIQLILDHWLPGGKMNGSEYDVRNPTRDDQHPGSFISIK